MRSWTLAALAAACLAAPSVASAAQITAGPSPSTYGNPNVEIAGGESLTFLNLDLTAVHDVTAIDAGTGGKPVFRSEIIGFGTEAPVVGAEKLGPGSYDFLCSIHTFMTGTLTVSGGGGGGGGGKAPTLMLSALEKKLAKVKKAGALKLRAKVNEAATVAVKVKAAGGGPKLASGSAELERGAGTVKAKLTKKGKRVVAKAEKLKLAVKGKATDADGNTGTESLKLKLR